MAIAAHFTHRSFPPATYHQALDRLDAAGFGAPEGRLDHIALIGPDGNLQVFDVWESPELLEAFGPTLVPLLVDLGVEVIEPAISPVHNRIEG